MQDILRYLIVKYNDEYLTHCEVLAFYYILKYNTRLLKSGNHEFESINFYKVKNRLQGNRLSAKLRWLTKKKTFVMKEKKENNV